MAHESQKYDSLFLRGRNVLPCSPTGKPSNWEAAYPECGGFYQSPIDIDGYNIMEDNAEPRFELTRGYTNASNGITLTNDGNTSKARKKNRSPEKFLAQCYHVVATMLAKLLAL